MDRLRILSHLKNICGNQFLICGYLWQNSVSVAGLLEIDRRPVNAGFFGGNDTLYLIARVI
jgi:hypothetical protein